MTYRKLKTSYFVLEGVNSFATSYYFNYLFFYMHNCFGFGNMANLGLSALNGFLYMFAAWYGGQFSQRFGYFCALRTGFSTMAIALAIGSFMTTATGQIGALLLWTLGMCFTWPTLEALVSEGESRSGLQQMIGIYNTVWAAGSALAYFSGGVILEWVGMKSLFWIPFGLHLFQLLLVAVVSRQPAAHLHWSRHAPAVERESDLTQPSSQNARVFLWRAWVANPFAYVAINTVFAVVPELANRLNLSLALAGIFCSLWLFARLGAFVWLWLWPGWHYHYGWMTAAYISLLGSFAVILLVPVLWVVVLAQLFFGLSVGLLYYSSLFYSMDVGETKGEHGGFHEAAIGAGIFLGPAVGAATLYFLPGHPASGAWAVSGLLLMGGFLMNWIRPSGPKT